MFKSRSGIIYKFIISLTIKLSSYINIDDLPNSFIFHELS